ncbi:DUF7344 domain-containing protein [Halorussus sp. AFM4]|uniref:DUF7344 domain-containing protein n=1 Tax=Halorussus sp. AFM4 TaxID=3421651 RepID=UPI003EBBC500
MTTDAHPLSTDAQSLDTVFALLRDRRRRFALRALADRESPVALDGLAAAVARREAADADGPPREASGTAAPASPTPDATPAATDDVAEALHHVHLPKLADAGVVDYDEADNTATLARTGDVTPFLDEVAAVE